MPDDFREYIEPINASAPLEHLQRGQAGHPVPPSRQVIHGTVHGIRRGQTHKEGHHRLDVSVGDDGATELLIRVPQGPYAGLEGKRVIIYIDD